MEKWQALVESKDHVCARYRLHPFHDVFHDRGVSLEMVPFPTSIFGRFQLGWRLGGNLLVVQRKLLPTWQTKWLKLRSKAVIFDFDDAVFLRDSYHPKGFHDKRRLRRFKEMVRTADRVIAGNRYLAEEASKWCNPAKVTVIPTCIDLNRYPLPKRSPESLDQHFRIVWIGSSSTLQGIEEKSALWQSIGQEIPGAKFRIICDRFPRFPGIEVEEIRWSSDSEATRLAEANVGVSWIPDDPWSRGKCGLKVLQYMAAGLPVVANPVGVHLEMILPGVNGFLPKNEQEWVEAIRWIQSHPKEATEMGRKGRELAEKEYSVRAGAKAWSALLDSLGHPFSSKEVA